MRVLGIAGYSGSGKTTLLVRLVPLLRAHGLTVATAKHAHHGFDPLPENHPAASWRAAGAREIVWSDPRSRLLLHELKGAPEPALEELYRHIGRVDLLLIEGYKFGAHEKIEVYRRDNGSPPLAARDPRVIALATDDERAAGLLAERRLPIFAINDVRGIAAFIARRCHPDPDTTEPELAGHATAER